MRKNMRKNMLLRKNMLFPRRFDHEHDWDVDSDAEFMVRALVRRRIDVRLRRLPSLCNRSAACFKSLGEGSVKKKFLDLGHIEKCGFCMVFSMSQISQFKYF